MANFPKKLAQTWIKLIQPEKSETFLNPQNLKVLTKQVATAKTSEEPKQVAVYQKREIAIVSCMRGKTLQFFSYSGNKLKLLKQLKFVDQCVETVVSGKYCLVTTTNFSRGLNQRSHLHIVNLETLKLISNTNTRGKWSKAIAVNQSWKLAFVSNWRSNDISIVDISNLENPRVTQLVTCGRAPRGIAISQGYIWLAGYYSRNITELTRRNGIFTPVFTSPAFDHKKYQGNMRDILISSDGKFAYISNMGRNLVNIFSIKSRKFIKTITVGRYPNSLAFSDGREDLLLVSCSRDSTIYVVDLKNSKVIGRSEETGEIPTGLASIKGGFLSTSFADNKLELHRFI